MIFSDATYYDCLNSETYHCETPEEAIEELLDLKLSPGCDVVAIISQNCPIIVNGYRRDEAGEDWIAAAALDLAIKANEAWQEEFADPDGEGFENSAIKYLQEEFEKALKWFVNQHEVWSCSKCGARSYSAIEVEAMMRYRHPEWFGGN